MKRKELTNTQWKRLKPLLPPQKPQTGRPALNHRRIISGILWILRTGSPLAGFAQALWVLEYRGEPLLSLAKSRHLATSL